MFIEKRFVIDKLHVLLTQCIISNTDFQKTGSKKTAILFRCHFWNKVLQKRYEKLQKQAPLNHDVFCLYDETSNCPSDLPKGYRGFTHQNMHNLHCGFISMMNNCDFPAIYFSMLHPEYDYIWLVDYDVVYTSNWNSFFNFYDDKSADMLVAYLRTYKQDPNWIMWKKHKCNFNINDGLASFFSMVRFSSSSLRYLKDRYKQSSGGFVESHSPTYLRQGGFSVHDINEFGKSHYTRKTFRWRPTFIYCLLPRKLYHPVKYVGLLSYMKDWIKNYSNNKIRNRWP